MIAMTPIRHDESDRPVNHPPVSDAVLVATFSRPAGDVLTTAIRYQRDPHGGTGYYTADGEALPSDYELHAYRPATPEEREAYETEAEAES